MHELIIVYKDIKGRISYTSSYDKFIYIALAFFLFWKYIIFLTSTYLYWKELIQLDEIFVYSNSKL